MTRRPTRMLALALASTALHGQTHKVAAPEKVTRAVAVYEWTGDLAKPAAARLVPVSLFIDAHFEDAGIYLSRPVPLSIYSGTVYEIDRAGAPIGTLTLDNAKLITTRHSATDDAPVSGWYGYGAFTSPEAARAQAKLKASKNPPAIVSVNGTAPPAEDSDLPTLARRPDDEPTNTTASTTPAKPTTGTIPDDDPDRPTLKHKDQKPENKKPKKEKDEGYVTPTATSLNDDPNRPTMRRGKPLGSISVPPLTGVPADLHQTAAVSDSTTRDEHPFAREWEGDSERLSTLIALQDLARKRLARYLTTNQLKPAATALAPTAPVPTRSTTTRRKAPAAPPPPLLALNEEKLTPYVLSYGGLPTFVYTAQTPLETGGPAYVTLVAQRLPSGELQISLSSITDANHLDRSPWLRLVDAVDPDASHRASLLFELRAQTSRQFALYRLVSATADQTFATRIIE